MAFLERATDGNPGPQTSDDLVPLMCSPLEDGGVALVPDKTRPVAERLATLVTVRMDPARRRIALSPGVPQFAEEASFSYQL